MPAFEYETLTDYRAAIFTVDKKQIGSGQARGFFVNKGIWTTLRQIQSDISNPLFALADAVIVTASDASSYFGLDPTTAEGQGNLEAAGVMVAATIMTEAQKIELLGLAIKTTYPNANATEQDFQIAKGTITRKLVSLPFEHGKCIVKTNSDCEAHTPQIYKKLTYNDSSEEFVRIAGFRTVQKSGTYRAACPYFSELYVDNAYNVIS
jgi:hypothetical protein